GQAKYTQVCSGCHQADLSGSDQAPALAGGEFLDRWDGQSVGDLADRIRTSMPLDDVGSLNVQLSADITAYLLQANSIPAGQAHGRVQVGESSTVTDHRPSSADTRLKCSTRRSASGLAFRSTLRG